MKQKSQNQELWATNISKMVITIGDLNLTFLPGKKYDLFNSKLGLDPKEVLKSASSGDLFKKNTCIILSQTRVKIPPPSSIILAKGGASTCHYFYEEIKEQNLILDDYQNLEDEKFVNDLLEIEENNYKPNKSKIKK